MNPLGAIDRKISRALFIVVTFSDSPCWDCLPEVVASSLDVHLYHHYTIGNWLNVRHTSQHQTSEYPLSSY